MHAVAKYLFAIFSDIGLSQQMNDRKQEVMPAVSSYQNERSELIDQMCATWGNDLNIRRRYFHLS